MKPSRKLLAAILFGLDAVFAVYPSIASAMPSQSILGTLPTQIPSAGSAPYLRGLELLGKGDLTGAENALNESLKIDPNLAEAYLVLAEVRLRQKKMAEAESFARKAVTMRPEVPNALVALGNILLLKGDGSQAEGAFRKALSVDANNVSAHMGLGELYLGTYKKPDEAAAAFSRAVALNSASFNAHFSLASAFAAAKRFPEAIAEFDTAAKLEPNNPQPRHATGRIQASQKNFDAALESFTLALQASPTFLPALMDRADVLAEKERNAEALADYEKVIGQQPANADVWLKSGLILQRLQRNEDAAKAYQKALSFNPKLPLAYNNLAWLALQKNGDLDEALGWSRKAVDLAGSVPHFHDTLGWILRARGDLAKAQEALETATRLKPPQAESYYHLGIVLQERGNKKGAAAAFRQALQIDRNFARADDIDKRLKETAK